MKLKVLFLGCILMSAPFSMAQSEEINAKEMPAILEGSDGLPELNPFSRDIEEQMNLLDTLEEQPNLLDTLEERLKRLDPSIMDDQSWESEEDLDFLVPFQRGKCRRNDCSLFIYVNKATQRMSVYQYGEKIQEFKVSTGKRGFETPNFDTNPNGRIYQVYTSTKYPTPFNNMAFAVFIRGGFAIHSATPGAEAKLGRPDSHGCVRLSRVNAKLVNELVSTQVKAAGLSSIWITVE